MTDGLKRVGKYVTAFSEKVAQCQNENSTMSDIQDAYSRLHRCRDRYMHEAYIAKSLDRRERTALGKVFENNNFIESMLKNVRQIGDHVLKRGGATLYRADQSSFRRQTSLPPSPPCWLASGRHHERVRP